MQTVRQALMAPMLTAVLAGATLALLSGCSEADGCTGATYDAPGSSAADDPIAALEAWLDEQDDFSEPPVEGWIQEDAGSGTDADAVVLTNEDADGWWLSVRRTSGGGWYVGEATDDAAGCAGKLD